MPNVFLHDDRVRPRGHGRTRENANRFAWRNLKVSINSRRLLPDDPLTLSRPARTGYDGITVHRRIIENRQRKPGENVPRRESLTRLSQRHATQRTRFHALKDMSQRLVFRDHKMSLYLLRAAPTTIPE
jgi:hypothetical protein